MTMIDPSRVVTATREPAGFLLTHELAVLNAIRELADAVSTLALITIIGTDGVVLPDGLELVTTLSPTQHAEMMATADTVLELLKPVAAPLQKTAKLLRTTSRTRLSSETWAEMISHARVVEV